VTRVLLWLLQDMKSFRDFLAERGIRFVLVRSD